jgi:hypothetical protein
VAFPPFDGTGSAAAASGGPQLGEGATGTRASPKPEGPERPSGLFMRVPQKLNACTPFTICSTAFAAPTICAPTTTVSAVTYRGLAHALQTHSWPPPATNLATNSANSANGANPAACGPSAEPLVATQVPCGATGMASPAQLRGISIRQAVLVHVVVPGITLVVACRVPCRPTYTGVQRAPYTGQRDTSRPTTERPGDACRAHLDYRRHT